MTELVPPISSSHPSVCVQCAARGRTCCELSSGDEEFCFPLSEAERARIVAADATRTHCFVLASNTPNFVEQLCVLLPNYAVRAAFPESGTHWRLATTAAGQCTFLGPAGCLLDRTMRPAYCRMFPLWSIHGQLTWFAAAECLAHAQCHSTRAMLTAMKTSREEIFALFATMCAELHLSKVTS